MKKILFCTITCFILSIILSSFLVRNVITVKAQTLDTAQSKAVCLIEPKTQTVILEKDAKKHFPIASMCKVMTLLLCFEEIDNGQLSLDDKVVVSKNASGMGGSQVFLEENNEYTVSNLLKAIIVASANDACVAMAEKISGSENSFIDKMNEKCKDLDMNNTVFSNCTGLPKPGQYSCAGDVAKMFSELIKHQDYFKFSKIWTDRFYHDDEKFTLITNTNKLIRFYTGCEGGKTGYTSEAGHCLVAYANKNDMQLISVIIGAPDSKTRFKEASDMFNFGFSEYVNKKVVDSSVPLSVKANVLGGKKDSVELVADKSFYLFSSKNQKRSVEINFIPNKNIKAPIKKGDLLGEIIIYENNIEIGKLKALSNEDIENKTYFDIIYDITNNWAIL